MVDTLINEKSTHEIEIFILNNLRKHENADTLSVIEIPNTSYTYVAKTDEWTPHLGKTLFWVPPDSLVPVTRPEFSFLTADAKYDKDSNADKNGGYARIKMKKIRGIVSFGILGILPESLKNSTNLVEALGIVHFEPQIQGEANLKTGGEIAEAPAGTYPKYDVDAFMKFGKINPDGTKSHRIFQDGELVWVSEKLHGCNSRYISQDGRLYCGSRTEWKKEFASPPNKELILKNLIEHLTKENVVQEEINIRINEVQSKLEKWQPQRNLWWEALDNTPSLKEFILKYPNHCVYGECYGQVQKGYNYGVQQGKCKIAVFDILLPEGTWMQPHTLFDLCASNNVTTVPLVKRDYPFNFEEVVRLAEGNSLMPEANHKKEGVVIMSARERWDEKLGRVKLKIINPEFK